MEEEFNLSEEEFDTVNLSPTKEEGIWLESDIKEFIKKIKYWGLIDLKENKLVIDYSKFQELAGEKLR
jgi:hypothetical protein